MADLNGDGKLDLVTAGLFGGAGVAMMRLGNGDGTFGASSTYASYSNLLAAIYDVLIADINSDSNLDILIAGGNALYGIGFMANLGNGDGTFSGSSYYSTGMTTVRRLAAGDFNGDGLLDIAGAGDAATANNLSVSLGAGSGNFGSATSFSTSASTISYGVIAADFNQDGVVDLSNSASGTTSLVLLNQTVDGTSPLIDFELKTLAGARQALSLFDQKLQQLGKQRGTIGSFQSRLAVGTNNLIAASENYSAAESRIRNADIAEESSKLISLKILQQASSSVLAQANLQPQLALKLLGN